MAYETFDAIKSGDPSMIGPMHDIDVNLDKFHDYCIIILNKAGYKDPRKITLLFSTLFLIELIGDEFKLIAKHVLYDYKPKQSFKSLIHGTELVIS